MKTVSTISFSRTSISLSDDCSGECELKLADVSQRITSTETTLALLECKLRSIPGLEYDGAPMKGTAPRGATTRADTELREALAGWLFILTDWPLIFLLTYFFCTKDGTGYAPGPGT